MPLMREFSIVLGCCQHRHRVAVDEGAIAAQEPNEIRKTIVCPACNRIVILSFADEENRMAIEQEVID